MAPTGTPAPTSARPVLNATHPPHPSGSADEAARLRARDLDDLTLPFGLRRPRAVFTSLDPAQGSGDDAALYAVVTSSLLAVLAIWTVATRALPAMHPQHAPLLLALHMGAWMTGWLGLHAAGAAPHAPALRWICRAALLINTAMVLGALLR
jgi:acetyl esterase/lipase